MDTTKKGPLFIKFAKFGIYILESCLLPFSPIKGAFIEKEQLTLLDSLEAQSDTFFKEFKAAAVQLDNIQDITVYDKTLTQDNKWKVAFVLVAGQIVPKWEPYFPRLIEFLKKDPSIVSAFFSRLDPRKKIPSHRGLYRGIIRIHLGLDIPIRYKDCWLRVKDEKKHWEKGKAIAFDDGLEHEVQNNTDEARTVLIIDYLRPYPFPIAQFNKAIISIFKNSSYTKTILKNLK